MGYTELAKQLRAEANEWCANCCYKQGVSICAAPGDRKKDCDICSKLQAADAIEGLSIICRAQKAVIDGLNQTIKTYANEEPPKEEWA